MSGKQSKRARKNDRKAAPPARKTKRVSPIWLAVAAAAVLALVAAGLVLGRGHSGAAAAAPAAPAAAANDRAAAPSLVGTDPVTGRKVDLASFRGKPVVVNIWASWCPGCNKEAKDIARFARAHPGVQVLGIDEQDTRGEARKFYARWGWHHPSIDDPNGSLAASLGLQGLPTTIFLDRNHRIVTQIVGASTFDGFDAALASVSS